MGGVIRRVVRGTKKVFKKVTQETGKAVGALPSKKEQEAKAKEVMAIDYKNGWCKELISTKI